MYLSWTDSSAIKRWWLRHCGQIGGFLMLNAEEREFDVVGKSGPLFQPIGGLPLKISDPQTRHRSHQIIFVRRTFPRVTNSKYEGRTSEEWQDCH
jgi:hypothetical protein